MLIEPPANEDYQTKLAAQRSEGRRRWVEYLDIEGFIDAEATVIALFDRDCPCGCHPRLPTSDFHDYGFDCACTKTPEERAATWKRFTDIQNEYWDSPEGVAERSHRAAEEAELELWVDRQDSAVVFTSHGGFAPEQWQGFVDGIEFYFRERHDHWRIETELVYEPEAAPNVQTYDPDTDSFTAGRYHSFDGITIAEGVAGGEGYGETPVQRAQFITRLIREHYGQQACAHPGAVAFCPHCGVRQENAL